MTVTSPPILWDTDSLNHALGVEVPEGIACTSVSIDTRTLQKGALFVPIKGDNFDGHNFIDKAFEAGAAAVLMENPHEEAPDNNRYNGRDNLSDNPSDNSWVIQVPDTFEALNKLGHAARARTNAKVVAVTGSVGKTGVTQALQTILPPFGATGGSKGSLNNHFGVPLSLANFAPDNAFGVFECGMSEAGEIRQRVQAIKPDVAVITTVAAAHMEFFESEADIARAKAEIMEGLAPNGTIILPRDNPHFLILQEAAKKQSIGTILTFGTHKDADIRLISYDPVTGIEAQIEGQTYTYQLPLAGRHWAINSLIFLATLKALGPDLDLDLEKGIATFSRLEPQAGRGKVHHVSQITLIDDSYNANPASMQAAIEVLGQYKTARKIAILSDMKELGAEEIQMHKDLAGPLSAQKIDHVFTYGPLAQHIPADQHFESLDDLHQHLQAFLAAKDVVLVKGSNSTFYQARFMPKLLELLSCAEAEGEVHQNHAV